MFIKQSSLLLFTALLLAGCSNSSFESKREANIDAFQKEEVADNELANKAVCCNSFKQLTYKQISADGTITIPITAKSQAYNFPTGKSFVEAYKIAVPSRELSLNITSYIYSSVIAPNITLLDSNFNVTRTITSKQFVYEEAKLLKGDRLSATITVYRPVANNPRNETYILFHTSPQDMAGDTTIIHPAKAFAIANSTVPPSIDDPIIPHSATGLIELTVTNRGSTVNSSNSYNPLAIFSSDPAPTPVSVNEEEYNRKIINAVAKNEISQGLNLVHEAEALGSTTARATFTNAVKQRNDVNAMSEEEYNEQIINAVYENDIDTALAIVDKAEATGSSTARQTFIDALNKEVKPVEKAPKVKKTVDEQIREAVAAKQISKALEIVNKAEAAGSSTARQTFVDALQERDN